MSEKAQQLMLQESDEMRQLQQHIDKVNDDDLLLISSEVMSQEAFCLRTVPAVKLTTVANQPGFPGCRPTDTE